MGWAYSKNLNPIKKAQKQTRETLQFMVLQIGELGCELIW